MTIDLTITREDENGNEIDIDVECEVACHRGRSGVSCEFEGAVCCDTGEEIELTSSEIDHAEQKAWDRAD